MKEIIYEEQQDCPSPSWTTASTAEREGWYMSAVTISTETVSPWMIGEECVRVQSISYSLLCRWFRAAVLPQDKELETALFHRLDAKRCAVCGALFTPGSNRAKYCPECAGRMKRIKAAQRKRKQKGEMSRFRGRKPLVNQGFFEGVGGGLIDLSSDP